RSATDALALAARAEIRRALPDHAPPNRRTAFRARLAFAAVDGELVRKIPRSAVAADEVAQCRAAFSDRLLEHGAHACYERLEARACDAAGRLRRMDAGAVQRLARVDVADADYDMAVHEVLLDRDVA